MNRRTDGVVRLIQLDQQGNWKMKFLVNTALHCDIKALHAHNFNT